MEECGASPNSARALDATTAITIAAFRGHRDVARYLFAMGADPLLANDQGIDAVGAAERSRDATMAGFMRKAADAKRQGLSYAEFVEQIESKRKRAEVEEQRLRQLLEQQAFEQLQGADAAAVPSSSLWSLLAALPTMTGAFSGSDETTKRDHQPVRAQRAVDVSDVLLDQPFGLTWRDSPRVNATLLFQHALAVASLRRDGEVRYELERALALAPDAPFAPEARRLIDHVNQADMVSMESTWKRLLDLDASARSKTRASRRSMQEALDEILQLRDRIRDSSTIGGAAPQLRLQAETIAQGLVQHVQQMYGVDMVLRSTWLEDSAFPFSRGSIYGPGLARSYSCTCSHQPPTRSLASRAQGCASSIVVETWRFITHSYGLVGQQFLLGLLQTPRLCVKVMNPPFLERLWTPGIPGEAQRRDWDEALQRVPVWSPGQSCPDVVIRSFWPLDTEPFPCNSTLTLVFGATEHQRAPHRWLKNMGFWNATRNITLITPSQVAAVRAVYPGQGLSAPTMQRKPPPWTPTHLQSYENAPAVVGQRIRQ